MIVLYPPGTARGPCASSCTHTICAAQRALAACACVYCHDPIGYDEHLEISSDGGEIAHYDCVERAAKGAAA
jgi:hypothetical protein